MKKTMISLILTLCILTGTITGASASVMIVSSTNAYDDSDAMYHGIRYRNIEPYIQRIEARDANNHKCVNGCGFLCG